MCVEWDDSGGFSFILQHKRCRALELGRPATSAGGSLVVQLNTSIVLKLP